MISIFNGSWVILIYVKPYSDNDSYEVVGWGGGESRLEVILEVCCDTAPNLDLEQRETL